MGARSRPAGDLLGDSRDSQDSRRPGAQDRSSQRLASLAGREVGKRRRPSLDGRRLAADVEVLLVGASRLPCRAREGSPVSPSAQEQAADGQEGREGDGPASSGPRTLRASGTAARWPGRGTAPQGRSGRSISSAASAKAAGAARSLRRGAQAARSSRSARRAAGSTGRSEAPETMGRPRGRSTGTAARTAKLFALLAAVQ